MWRSCLLLLTLGCSLWHEALSQPGPGDCIYTSDIFAPGGQLELVPPGTVCARCLVDGVAVQDNVEFFIGSLGPDAVTDVRVEDGVLIIYNTTATFPIQTAVGCEINGDPGTFVRNFINVANFLPPTVTGDRVVVERDDLSLTCRSLNSPSNPPVEWLSPDGSQIGQGGSLMVPVIERSQAGTYVCRIIPSDETFNLTESNPVEVVVQYPPEVTAGSLERIDVPVGIGDLVISCTYDGVPTPDTVVWVRASMPVDISDPRISVESTDTSTTLTVTAVEEEEGGMYTCLVGNDLGNRSAVTNVRIQLRPLSPTNLVVVDDSETMTSLDISWDAPSFNGFSPISGYRVQALAPARGFSKEFMFGASTTQGTLDGLPPLSEITVQVFAQNEAGLEGESAETTGETLSLRIGPVESLEAEALSSTELRVTWEEPSFNSTTTAPVDSYRVTYAPAEGGPTVTVPTTDTSIDLTDLEMGTRYNIFVVPINSADDGESSMVTMSTLIIPPSEPRNFTGDSPDPFTLTVSWIRSLADGGRSIARFELTISSGVSDTETIVVPAGAGVDGDIDREYSHQFDNLDQNITYQLSVTAVTVDTDDNDRKRTSEPSTLTLLTRPVGPPRVPNKPTPSGITDTSATLSWNNPGGYPEGYILEVKLGILDRTDEDVMPFNITSLSQSLSGLQILTAYDARVLSINANGPSDFSATTRFSTVGAIMVRGENGENATVEAEEGETVTLTCSLQQQNTSNPVQYTWSREGGESLPDGAEVVNGVLRIRDAQEDDSGVYICTASGVQGSFTLSITGSPDDSSGVSTVVIIIVVCVCGVTLLIFLLVVAIALYCFCCRGNGKGGSPHRRTYSFRPKHWTEHSGSSSMPREQQRKELVQSFHMPDDYTATTSFNTVDRVRRSPSPPSHSKASNSHAGAEPTTSFQLREPN